MKYIDADKLIAEIRKLCSGSCISESDDYYEYAKNEIIDIITSLRQEQPEVDLDFQVFAEEMDAVFNLPKDVTENTEENPLNWEYAIARHFYELGFNARKEE